MAKGIFAVAVLVVSATAAAPVHAIAKPIKVNGCSVLAESVKSAVLTASMPGRAGQFRTGIEHDRGQVGRFLTPAYVCSTTARVTTEAFSAAIARIGMRVGWRDESIRSGDYCDSHHLSECYPHTVAGAGLLSAASLVLVHEAWKAVRVSVSSFMPFGTSSDWSSFGRTELTATLQSAIDHYVEGPDRRSPGPGGQQYGNR